MYENTKAGNKASAEHWWVSMGFILEKMSFKNAIWTWRRNVTLALGRHETTHKLSLHDSENFSEILWKKNVENMKG